MKKKIIIFTVAIILGIIAFLFITNFNDAEDEKKLTRQMVLSSEFPADYQPYIDELKRKYPNWEFKALYTNLDWDYVIDQENIFGKNLVPKSYSDSWKNTTPGEYNVEVDSGWVDSSRTAVEYAMDPRNFLNNVRVFQFEELSYNQNTNTVSSIEKILYGTEFYNKIVEYKNSSGTNIVTNKKYSDLILSAAQTSKVSAFHLASRIKQEVGPFLSHSSISGTVSGFEGLYNFYNIGATSSSEPMGAIKNGLQYAKDGKGASTAIKNKYLIPWNTKERAITGGAIFIGSSYINLGQNTIYLQKFHVYDTQEDELFWHQYMTNVLAPYSESKLIYTGYSNSNLLDSAISFVIPIYENMPDLPCTSPAISASDFSSDNTQVYANVETTLNVRSGPGTSYEVLKNVEAGTVMTRIAKGKQKGELWDRVILQNGMVGYVFQQYLEGVPDREVKQIELSATKTVIKEGESVQLNATIIPSDANDKTLQYTSSDSKIATVNSSGKVTGVKSGTVTITAKASNGVQDTIEIKVYTPTIDNEKISFEGGLVVTADEITGLESSNNNTVEGFLNKIQTSYTVEVYNSSGKKISGKEIIGTGSTVRILENNDVVMEYNVILYGDANGDGKINSVDLLVIQRHILEIELLKGVYIKAGNIAKNGKNPNSVDCLLIQRHILGLQKIEQGL